MLKKIMLIMFLIMLIPFLVNAEEKITFEKDKGVQGPNAGFENIGPEIMKELKIGEGFFASEPVQDTNENELNPKYDNKNNEDDKDSDKTPEGGDLVYVKLDDLNTISFHYISQGEFTMGVEDGRKSEKAHKIEITKGFWIGKFEITQPQWQAVMNDNPSRNKNVQQPVTDVSFKDIEKFIKKMKEMKFPVRLPTEAEWEYACRADTESKFYFGDKIDEEYCVYNNSAHRNYNPEMRDAGSKKPNNFGLHDMSGNALEWVNDIFDPEYYDKSEKEDPQGPEKNDDKNRSRVVRGGSYLSNAGSCTSFRRDKRNENFKAPNLGFRLIWMPQDENDDETGQSDSETGDTDQE